MKRIEVGMLVRVVEPIPNPRMRWTIGMVAKVLRQDLEQRNSWDLEGLEFNIDGRRMGFTYKCLEPINPDNQASSWEEVQKLTKWNPMRVEA